MSSVGISKNSPSNGVFAAPLSVEGVDDNDLDGHIPRDILLKGTRIVIPRPDDTGPKDQLMVFWVQNSIETTIFDHTYPAGIIDPFVYVTLTPQQMATDGVAQVYYKFWKGGGGNPDESPPRMLTIDHTALLSFPEPLAVHATLWGYWNNNTNPPLTSGGTLRIRPLNNIAQPLDVAWIEWRGYRSLNGSGPEVTEAYGRWDKTLYATDITNGFNYVVPFQNHISSLIDNDSAIVVCQLFRGGRIIAESEKGLVKVDRITPGKPGPFGLNSQGETIVGIIFVPKKQRAVSVNVSSDIGPFADIAVETLTGGFIAKAVMDSGILPINFTRTLDELDNDSIEVKYREKGEVAWTDYPMSIDLVPVVDRPPSPIPLPLNASLLAEKATSPGPTVWELKIELYKGGGGNYEESNTLEFTVDQLAPVNTKNPPKKIRPTPAPVFVNGTPLPLRNIDQAWITANPNMNFTVNVTYFGRRVDDNLTVWLSSATLGSQRVQLFNGAVPAAGTFDIPSNELLQFANGRVNLIYRWDDWLGNLGEESVSTPILTLALPQPPLAKKAPLVPETDPNYSEPLYWENFEGGIAAIVENAFIEHAVPGDQIFLYIKDPLDVTNHFETPKQPWANANLSFDLTYAALDQIFNGADEPKDAEIHYEIERAGIPSNAISPTATISLAFDIAGLKPPTPPDLNNPDLQLPVVTGVSNIANVVEATDRDKQGTFKVTNGLTDPDFEPEHTVKCYLGASAIAFAEFSPLVAVSEFSVPIPASEMAKLTPPSDTARYTIEKTGTGKNVNKSLPQTVTVNRIPIVLPEPTIKIRNPVLRDFIECYAMISPTSAYVLGLQIRKDLLLPPGTNITVHFEAHSNAAGTALIAGTKASAPYTIAAANVPDVAGVGTDANFKAAQPKRGAVAWGKY
ncbi:hypothetical protein JFT91_17520 [Pseudomonas sp. TH08]|uniref:hypothetical protein n=1 Tax=unclassified Pseudomonas TaxID=196821 RepID=UPI001913898A|nr:MULTISPECIES: hypothetical protein [unclassified Pseudomonas]MBK5529261.1 hypothetical protein [Pseudomonas sp. TH06]MBK5534377.1 hypothetical protein [Pseudomonas sp. TH08]